MSIHQLIDNLEGRRSRDDCELSAQPRPSGPSRAHGQMARTRTLVRDRGSHASDPHRRRSARAAGCSGSGVCSGVHAGDDTDRDSRGVLRGNRLDGMRFPENGCEAGSAARRSSPRSRVVFVACGCRFYRHVSKCGGSVVTPLSRLDGSHDSRAHADRVGL